MKFCAKNIFTVAMICSTKLTVKLKEIYPHELAWWKENAKYWPCENIQFFLSFNVFYLMLENQIYFTRNNGIATFL